jgi:hypothetical protein
MGYLNARKRSTTNRVYLANAIPDLVARFVLVEEHKK